MHGARGIAAIGLALAVAMPGLSQEGDAAAVAGPASALESDLLSLSGVTFRLHGIDGFEFHQSCFVDGTPWACGVSAVRALQTLLGAGTTSCVPTGERDGAAILANCMLGEMNIAETMVREGWALALGEDFAAAQQAAQAEGAGAWEGVFVTPWDHRADIAAIEDRTLALLPEALRARAEAALLTGGAGVAVFDDIAVSDTAAGTTSMQYQTSMTGPGAGFVSARMGQDETFSWQAVAAGLDAWQSSAVAAIRADVADAVWSGLRDRPAEQIQVADASAYYAAIGAHASPWIEAGRQPVLVLVSPMVPSWIGNWFAGSPPQGAEITQKDIGTPGYLGTMNGIDVYVGKAPETASLLFPDDLLETIVFDRNVEGGVVTVVRKAATGPAVLSAQYALALEWREDPVVWLRYPANEAQILNER